MGGSGGSDFATSSDIQNTSSDTPKTKNNENVSQGSRHDARPRRSCTLVKPLEQTQSMPQFRPANILTSLIGSTSWRIWLKVHAGARRSVPPVLPYATCGDALPHRPPVMPANSCSPRGSIFLRLLVIFPGSQVIRIVSSCCSIPRYKN